MKTMKMKVAAMALAAAAFATYPAAAQTADSSAGAQAASHKGVLGYLDTKTGAFRPVIQGEASTELEAASAAPTTGKFVYNLTITVASSIPSSQPIECSATAGVSEINNTTFQARSFEEGASVLAKRSGSTATCTVTIPYSWTLGTPASDSVSIGFSIVSGATTSTTIAPSRYSYQSLGSIKVPANGATTTETLKATI